jgi:hypothetical protein
MVSSLQDLLRTSTGLGTSRQRSLEQGLPLRGGCRKLDLDENLALKTSAQVLDGGRLGLTARVEAKVINGE